MTIPAIQAKASKLKFHHLYCLLALFDVSTVAISLFLSHKIVTIYGESVDEQLSWTQRQARLSQLSELAAHVNAPGNDVFTTGDVDAESQRLTRLWSDYQKVAHEVRDDLKSCSDQPDGGGLPGQLEAVDHSMRNVREEARQILDHFRQGNSAAAGPNMSRMDQHFASALGALGGLSRNVGELQAQRLRDDANRATALSKYEWLIMGLVIVMVGGVAFYAYMLATKMARDETALVSSNKKLEANATELRSTQIELEQQMLRNADYAAQIKALGKSQGIIEFGMDGIVIAANEKYLDTFGYTFEEIRGRQHQMFCEPAYAASAEYEALWEKLNRGEFCAAEYKRLGKNGRELWIQATYNPILDHEAKPFKVVKFAIDVSENKRLQRELTEVSHQAGMAEVATGVLHNVGNVLNSVNVSANLLSEKLRGSRVERLSKAANVISQHQDDLASFLTVDKRGRHFPRLLEELAANLSAERDTQLDELRSLTDNIEHVKEIVNMQQTYAHVRGTTEPVALVELLEHALKINDAALVRHRVDVIREFADVAPIVSEKHKLLQIVVNLISNAKYAVSYSDRHDKTITLGVAADDESIRIQVRDNGIGIPRENLTKVFSHGFTTGKDGHGFGLHSCALTAQELGGSLSVHSDGTDSGATFTLRLPVKKESLCTL